MSCSTVIDTNTEGSWCCAARALSYCPMATVNWRPSYQFSTSHTSNLFRLQEITNYKRTSISFFSSCFSFLVNVTFEFLYTKKPRIEFFAPMTVQFSIHVRFSGFSSILGVSPRALGKGAASALPRVPRHPSGCISKPEEGRTDGLEHKPLGCCSSREIGTQYVSLHTLYAPCVVSSLYGCTLNASGRRVS